jgi:CDP-diglyceride synthetase
VSAVQPEAGAAPGPATGDGRAPATGDGADERTLPPVLQLGVAALVLVIVAGIYLAAETGRHPSLVPAIVAVAAAAVLVLAAAVLLARVRDFAWSRFRQVFGWALLEYSVIAGMLVYIFVRDGTPAGTLGLFVAALVVFAVDIPMIFGFSVARYQAVPAAGTAQP